LKLKISFLILSFLSLIFPKKILATAEINKFGIHILDPSDLPKAQELVNSSGGDWGWVTVVIRDDDMNQDKWQDFMDECRIRHLIPLVRVATHLEGENWAKPKLEDSQKWAEFLNNLNWPVKDQYVIVFNEPNQAKEWGGEINPKEYAKILSEFNSKFKILNSKFKILNAGFDLAAPNGKDTMEALSFMEEMNKEIPGIFEKLDGWVSHSYPNHGFLGKPWEIGKTSIRGYEWELNILKNNFKIQKDLPVFITETGWPKVGSEKWEVRSGKNYYDGKTVAEFFKYAFENVWLKDERIKAITPFVLNYPGELFAKFSWLDQEGNSYPQFETIKNLKKVNWWPEQEEKYEMISIILPPFLPANTKFNGTLVLKNIGQSILGEKGKLEIPASTSGSLKLSNLVIENQRIKPGELVRLNFSLSSVENIGEQQFTWKGLPLQKIKVLPPSIISQTKYSFWEKIILNLKEIFSKLQIIYLKALKTNVSLK